jgi:hypothetical protein
MAKVSMDKKKYEKEHKELVDILKHGTKKDRTKEANKQEKEVNEKKRGKK